VYQIQNKDERITKMHKFLGSGHTYIYICMSNQMALGFAKKVNSKDPMRYRMDEREGKKIPLEPGSWNSIEQEKSLKREDHV
jgi:hypothetical protein